MDVARGLRAKLCIGQTERLETNRCRSPAASLRWSPWVKGGGVMAALHFDGGGARQLATLRLLCRLDQKKIQPVADRRFNISVRFYFECPDENLTK
jgi:hypothetical protein